MSKFLNRDVDLKAKVAGKPGTGTPGPRQPVATTDINVTQLEAFAAKLEATYPKLEPNDRAIANSMNPATGKANILLAGISRARGDKASVTAYSTGRGIEAGQNPHPDDRSKYHPRLLLGNLSLKRQQALA